MSAAPVLTVWLQLLGLLAAEAALVVVAAALLQCSTKGAWWRRTIWQVCVLSLLALPLFEVSGAARGTAGWLGRIIRIGNGGSGTGIAAGHSGGRVPALPVTDEFRRKVAEQFALNRQRETTAPSKTQSSVTLAQGPHPEAGPVTAEPKRN